MARGKASTQDQTTLRMALIGYELERQRIEEKIREIRAKLGGSAVRAAAAAPPRRKRNLSAAARRRIAEAQKRRWAEHRKRQAKAAK